MMLKHKTWFLLIALLIAGCAATREERAENPLNGIRRAAYESARLGQDTTALRHYRALAEQAISPREKELVLLQIASLERIVALTTQASRWRGEIDSLRGAVRSLSAGSAAQGRQIRELEAQLTKTADELRRLKEVDARLSGRRP